jgi:hypothetical protein
MHSPSAYSIICNTGRNGVRAHFYMYHMGLPLDGARCKKWHGSEEAVHAKSKLVGQSSHKRLTRTEKHKQC